MIDPKAGRATLRRPGMRIPLFALVLTIACLLCFLLGGYVGYWLLDRHPNVRSVTADVVLPYHTYMNKIKDDVIQKIGTFAELFSEGICSNSCPTAHNGVCEEGRGAHSSDSDVSHPLLCDLGTDCADCGKWDGPVPATMSDNQEPVAYARSIGMAMFARATKTKPQFIAVHTDRKLDMDVSEHLSRDGMIESGITLIFYKVLDGKCIRADGSRALVLDVGANFGYFTFYAASMGCRVIAWEPVPRYSAFIKHGLAANNLTHLVDLREQVAGAEEGAVEMSVPQTINWGTASVAGINSPDQTGDLIKVPSERIDKVVKEDVLLMKVDVEGYEPNVFRGAQDMLLHHSVENIVFEYTPAVGERVAKQQRNFQLLEENPKRLVVMLLQGYTMVQMPDNYAKGTFIWDWESAIPALPEVTTDHLKYDIADSERVKEWTLGCPVPIELKQYPAWKECNSLNDFHPKSLRSVFPYNTNLWATKNGGIIPKLGHAGAFDLNQDALSTWTSVKDPQHGIAGFSCPHLQPEWMVRQRCNCSWLTSKAREGPAMTPEQVEKCQEEERLVMKLLQEKKMPVYDL